jgi:multidrug efflux system membrane fusion protein
VKSDSTVEARNVTIRLAEGDDAAILQGVATGEVVVTDGVDKLQPGTRVAARTAGKSDPPQGQAP